MTLTRRHVLTSLLATAVLPARSALALTGEPFPVFESDAKLVAYKYRRREVDFDSKEAAGTIVIDTKNRLLYHVLGQGKAMRYGVSVGKAGMGWTGATVVGRKAKWPTWTPTPDHIARRASLAKYLPDGMPGGPDNPMGARALYLYQGDVDTVYRIHGTEDPKLIGRNATAGCFGMLNVDVIHLYDRVEIGTRVVVF